MPALILVLIFALLFGPAAKDGYARFRHKVGIRVQAGSEGVESSLEVGVGVKDKNSSVELEIKK